jgi:hypothetical protein
MERYIRETVLTLATRVPPKPCGAYTRNWLPAQRFLTARQVHDHPESARHIGPDQRARTTHLPR